MGMPLAVAGCPFCRWMRRHCEVKNAPAIVRQHQEHIQDLKPDSWDGEGVYRYQAPDVVLKEGSPSLRRRFPTAHQIFTHAGFADIDTKFQQFSMNARR